MQDKRGSAIFERAESDLAATQVLAARPGATSGFNLQSISHKLWRGKWLLVYSAAAFSLMALMLGALQPPLYKSQASLEVQSPNRNIGRSQAEDAGSSNESYIQTQIRIIESRLLLERVLRKLNDQDRARIVERPRFWWRSASNDQNVEWIQHHITAQPSEQAGIVDVTFLSPDAVAGAHFLNFLSQELADLNVERSWRAMQHNRQWTERQIDELRRRWEQSEQVLAEYSQISGLKAAAPASFAARQTKPLAQEQARHEANDAKLNQLKNRLADLNKQIAQWQALYGPAGGTVQKLRAEASAAEAAIRQRRASLQTKNASPPVPSSYARVDNADAKQITAPAERAHLIELRQEADSNREIYESTAAHLKEASIANAVQIGDISVVDAAIPATRASTPSQWLIGTMGGLIGLLAGIAFVALRDRYSRTFSEPDLLAHYLGMQVLGAIPLNRFPEEKPAYDADAAFPELQLNFDIDLRTAEAYRSLRSSLLLRAGERSGPRRLVFTSAGAGEGKTSVVGNLGAALASAQRRVLLVDGNLREPGLHKIFGADNEHGLADLLTRQISESPIASRDVIRETQIPDLYLLSAGKARTRAPEILSSAQLPQLIREFAKGFDLVLIDSPPVLPYADVRSLALAADAVVLVVKAGSTDRQAALQARDTITQDGTPIIGSILTEWDVERSAAATSGKVY